VSVTSLAGLTEVVVTEVNTICFKMVGLADEACSDAIPDAAGGEGGHGTAKPDSVIHRYIFHGIVGGG
jgi:hypothetical protein